MKHSLQPILRWNPDLQSQTHCVEVLFDFVVIMTYDGCYCSQYTTDIRRSISAEANPARLYGQLMKVCLRLNMEGSWLNKIDFV